MDGECVRTAVGLTLAEVQQKWDAEFGANFEHKP